MTLYCKLSQSYSFGITCVFFYEWKDSLLALVAVLWYEWKFGVFAMMVVPDHIESCKSINYILIITILCGEDGYIENCCHYVDLISDENDTVLLMSAS